MESLDFSHEPDLNIDILCRRVAAFNPEADLAILEKAYKFAEKAHSGQKRSSGEDYIIHPMNVAGTLIKLRMDTESIAAGFLHDVVEDCDVSSEEITENFGEEISAIVEGLTKISKIKFKTKEESQVENFRKMVVAMARDIRVIIVKLSDRMHNMRTLQYVSEEKQKKIAQETIDIYVPLASRLGINSVKSELEDLCLRYLKSEMYYRLAEKVAMTKTERESYIKETISVIEDRLREFSLDNFEVTGRPKHFYSIFKKMQSRGVDFEQLHDILAFRILVGNITECYKALGIIHSCFKPVPGRFKDYIAIPKVNNYQSLHTTVVGPKAERIEIQIRTHEMHEVAETGVAAHWTYKSGGENNKALKWVQDLLEFNRALKNNAEFMDVVKSDLDVGGIFIFTPTGDVLELGYGATPLDFAYSIHTEVGNRCVGAKVNGKMVPLRYRLKSGDTVEILTSKTQTPKKDWLKIAKTSRAKTKIRQWLLKIEREKNQQTGQEILEKSLRIVESSLKSFRKSELATVLEEFKLKNEEELFIHIGSGRYTFKDILEASPNLKQKATEDEKEGEIQEVENYSNELVKTAKKSSSRDNAVLVDGTSDVLVRIAKCCNPIPGDPIVGFITRGRGITVHKSDCERILEEEPGRTIQVNWNSEYAFKYPVQVRVITHDRPGVLSSISKVINNVGINIRSAIAKSLPDMKGSFIFEVEVNDYRELLKTISAIESLEYVISVNRC